MRALIANRFNWGGTFLAQDVDDHVGDWYVHDPERVSLESPERLTLHREHNMIRFSNGVPTQMWFSQHEDGEAFTYDCLEKQGIRVRLPGFFEPPCRN